MFHSSQSTGWADQWADQVRLLGNSQGKLISKEARIKETRGMNPNQGAWEELTAGDWEAAARRVRGQPRTTVNIQGVLWWLWWRGAKGFVTCQLFDYIQCTRSVAVLSMLWPSVLKKPRKQFLWILVCTPCLLQFISLYHQNDTGIIRDFIRTNWGHGYGTTLFPTIGDYYYDCE